MRDAWWKGTPTRGNTVQIRRMRDAWWKGTDAHKGPLVGVRRPLVIRLN